MADDEHEDETTAGGPPETGEGTSEQPGFTQGDTPSEEELSDPEVGGVAGGGPSGA